jgi:hypothetical protein
VAVTKNELNLLKPRAVALFILSRLTRSTLLDFCVDPGLALQFRAQASREAESRSLVSLSVESKKTVRSA